MKDVARTFRAEAGQSCSDAAAARTRRELFQNICTVVFELAPRWDGDGGARIVLSDRHLTRADVEITFDAISEKYRVAGISLDVREQAGGGLLEAILVEES